MGVLKTVRLYAEFAVERQPASSVCDLSALRGAKTIRPTRTLVIP